MPLNALGRYLFAKIHSFLLLSSHLNHFIPFMLSKILRIKVVEVFVPYSRENASKRSPSSKRFRAWNVAQWKYAVLPWARPWF